MKRTLKRELKVPEIDKRETIQISVNYFFLISLGSNPRDFFISYQPISMGPKKSGYG